MHLLVFRWNASHAALTRSTPSSNDHSLPSLSRPLLVMAAPAKPAWKSTSAQVASLCITRVRFVFFKFASD